MKKIVVALFCLVLSGCASWVHKNDVEQGNIVSPEDVSRLHKGMTESQVIALLGSPMLVNVFTAHRMDYVYTQQKGHHPMTEKQLNLIFANGRLQSIQDR